MLDAVVVKVRPCLSTHLASPYLIPLWPLLTCLPTVLRQGVCHHRPARTPPPPSPIRLCSGVLTAPPAPPLQAYTYLAVALARLNDFDNACAGL